MEMQRQETDGAKLAKGLAWFGIALGAAEVAAPTAITRVIGVERDRRAKWLVRAIGAGEVLAGVAMLASRFARARQNPQAIFSVTIARTPREVYAFYRHFERLPTFMDYLESVTESAAGHSHWVARLPGKGTVEWDAKIVEDIAGRRIAWTSTPGSAIQTSGAVTFSPTPGRDHTEVRVEMELGARGLHSAKLARWFARPQIKGDLRRLKQVLEAGEVLSNGGVS
jgi:uncharacterized membrane protein